MGKRISESVNSLMTKVLVEQPRLQRVFYIWSDINSTIERGGRSIVISHKCRVNLDTKASYALSSKIIPGTRDKISHCAKFHSCSCLGNWFPKIRSCRLASWESTFFSQNLPLLNTSFTVYKLYTWLTHPKQLCGMPDMSVVSLTGFWCPWQRGNN